MTNASAHRANQPTICPGNMKPRGTTAPASQYAYPYIERAFIKRSFRKFLPAYPIHALMRMMDQL
jgi:hypothetical protein